MTTDGPAGTGATAENERFIPVRKAELIDALVERGPLGSEGERADFRQVCRLLAAIYHYEYFERLERLRHDYFYFNPEVEPHARFDAAALAAAYSDLVDSFAAVLADANFVELPYAEVEHAHQTRATMRVELKVPLDDFREIRFFRRGHRRETIATVDWFGLRKRTHEVTVYDDVILFAAMKPEAQLGSERERKLLARRRIRPGSVLLKYFRNIAKSELNALFPNARVVMSTFDKLVLSLPALAGAVPLLLNLVSTATVLFAVIGFYLGVTAAAQEDEMKAALAALSGLLALVGFVTRQWLRYQRQSLKYQKELSDNVYFHNVNNNAGIFDYMVGVAEDQECKEAFLAYCFLRTAKAPSTQAELDRRIEAWLAESFGIVLAFDVGAALTKLDRLGLLARDGGRLAVPTAGETLARLACIWNGYFEPALASNSSTSKPTWRSTR